MNLTAKLKISFFVFLLALTSEAQLVFSDQKPDLGTIPEAYEISGDIIITNTSGKKIFLLRADADKGVKVYASKKTLQPNDTALLLISFIPESAGKFKKKISLVSSDAAKPYLLELSGDLKKLKADDKLACYYFGSRRKSNVKIKDEPIVIKEPEKPRDMSNKIPDVHSEPVVTYTPEVKTNERKNELPVLIYKPNNILFLIDVSTSMRDSLKLPLMKKAMFTLIDAVRDIDRITLVTYADSVKVIKEAVSGSSKEELKEIVHSLKAKGMTKGKKAILKSQEVAQRHFISEGNNQIFLVTDGKFMFSTDDQKKWARNQSGKNITLTTVAFGNDKEAIKNLKKIADTGGGSFIHIKKREGSEQKLLEEIKIRSKRD